jgi:hypothetical protein
MTLLALQKPSLHFAWRLLAGISTAVDLQVNKRAGLLYECPCGEITSGVWCMDFCLLWEDMGLGFRV